MMNPSVAPFLCDVMDKSIIRTEWEKWLRSFTLYLEAEDITTASKKRSKLLHLGGAQLQEVAYNIPDALVEGKEGVDPYEVLVGKLTQHFSPKRNSTFERHLFRSLKPMEGETLSKFILKLRGQAAKCQFGKTEKEVIETNIKDKLIDVWAPIDLKKRLLEKEHDLTQVVEMCQIHESIKSQTTTMVSDVVPLNVNKIANKTKFDTAECDRCGRKGHTSNDFNCPAKNAKCNKCMLQGHFAVRCKTKRVKREHGSGSYDNLKRRRMAASRVRCINDEGEMRSEEMREFDCFKIDDDMSDERIRCSVGGRTIDMVIDSGSRFNLISEGDWSELRNGQAVVWNIRSHSPNQFKAYAADKLLKVLQVFDAPIATAHKELIATFYVIEKGSQSLLGRDSAVKLNVLRVGLNVHRIEDKEPFPKIKNVKVSLAIDCSIRPVQQPIRRIPIALETKVAEKINEALHQDIIERVPGPSLWISPVVIVFKPNGDVRLCIDMRRANEAILRENYPLPTFDSFMTKLRHAKFFSRLDLKNAYHQIELDEASGEITTFITHKGLFRYKRLMFGVNSAPEIFQRIMEELLSPCKNVLNYIDDVIIFGSSEQEHDEAQGDEVQLSGDGKVLRRNISHVKKIPSANQQPASESEKAPGTLLHPPIEQHSTLSRNSGAEETGTSQGSLRPESAAKVTSPPTNVFTGDQPSAQQEGIKLKLKKIGGMWQP
ncbi:uncharacterized protein K02A2.6-like [Bactrocera neohumeralis]|uniref:uncharacterized protein K02A2.6-like n=1 Tax=Bactrocera neohumeralis TaxID=98809 RepID=UPI0021656208|nr:uncharacterized protein K02A2.6-like [Bactrocera neohumeralis]